MKKITTYAGNPASKKEGNNGASRSQADLDRNLPKGPYGNNSMLHSTPTVAVGLNERGKTVFPS